MTTTGYTRTELDRAVAAAIRAPSLHNSQPWRFRLRDGAIEVLRDGARLVPVADGSGWAARIACGAAIYNARLALAVAGRPALVRLRPRQDEPDLMARLLPAEPAPATPAERDLLAAVPNRHSNRAPFLPTPVPPDARHRLLEAARAEGCWLDLIIGPVPVAALAELAYSAHRVLNRDPAYARELLNWTRTEPADDGVPVDAGGPSPEPHDLLPARGFGDRPRHPGRDFEPEPLVAVLGAAGDSPTDQLQAGQALQRVLLTVTRDGLAVSMLSQPIEVPAAREQLRLSLGRFGIPQMVMRIGYGAPGLPTPRRGAAQVTDA
ncbi:Acg family FMN-binding oxidoreductase [Rhizomonospora bruguierae]|uniref:Acg family FMN-binding oxidoreductase n=1 Tax=Rhizomonospora bruguierae TaxID=1581705 RepID=UPI001BD0FF98|nr:nitroreductase family protein [Micromonospora sp. NBRC 107566]